MSARTGLWMLIAISAVAMVFAVFHGAARPHAAAVAKPHAHERPWLSHEAMHELVGDGGGPGPLFGALTLGGTPPDAEARDKIQTFARANAIEIRFEVAQGELSAIRVGVTFGGCCGYEGADAFGRLLHRTRVFDTDCYECRGTPANDWNSASDDGVAIHGHVAVNRVDVRWEAMLTLPELLDRAEAIAGRPRTTVRAHAGDRWRERSVDQVLDVPFVFTTQGDDNAHGLHLAIEHGRIAEVSFALHSADHDDLGDLLRKRWGRPQISDDGTWTWRSAERVITVDPDSYNAKLVIRANAPATTTALAPAAATPAPRS